MDFVRVRLPDGRDVWVTGSDVAAARRAVAERFGVSAASLIAVGSRQVQPGATVLNQSGEIIGTGGGQTGTGVSPAQTGGQSTSVSSASGGDDQGDVGLQTLADRGIQDASVGGPGGINAGNTPASDLPESAQPGFAAGEDPGFDFGSFANALTARGFNPEGVFGGTFRQAFNPLVAARDVGTLTGGLPPIGSAPGSLQNFFGSNLGSQRQLATNVFNDLINRRDEIGGTALGANFVNPTLGTQEGDNAFNAVRNLARQAAIGRFGGFANQFLPSNTGFDRRFEQLLAASPGTPGTIPDLLEFAQSQFGL